LDIKFLLEAHYYHNAVSGYDNDDLKLWW